jgi:hypothetical protein
VFNIRLKKDISQVLFICLLLIFIISRAAALVTMKEEKWQQKQEQWWPTRAIMGATSRSTGTDSC